MLQPKRTQYRKHQKGKRRGIRSNQNNLDFGRFGIKALQHGIIEGKRIEAVRRVMTRRFKRSGQIWIRVFPDIVRTTKPSQSRMGKGKGGAAYWICRVQPGQILYEIAGVSTTVMEGAFKIASHKLGIKIGVFSRD
jgi:large subunit ribosomal protein L16